MNIEDRAIMRARNLSTPLSRLRELAPRLLSILPATIGSCADRLAATRQEVKDTAAFADDHIANLGDCLVRRDRHLAAFDERDSFYLTRRVE